MQTPKKTLEIFKVVANLEGWSMVILLFFSIMKRVSDFDWAPLGVTYVGSIHGGLFVLYLIVLYRCWDLYNWTAKRLVVFFIASIIPFMPFWVHKKLKEEN